MVGHCCLLPHIAADVVKFFLKDCCADTEQRCDYRDLEYRIFVHLVKLTPLCCAAVAGNIEVVKTLVQHGADVNALSADQKTPVHVACILKNVDVVKFLVKNGADVNIPDEIG